MTAIAVLLASTCATGCQPLAVQRYVAPIVQQVYTQPLYFVGAPIRVESIVEQQKRTDPDYQEFLEFKAYKEGASRQRMSQQTSDDVPPAPSGVTVKAACSSCHGKATPDGEFFLDGNYGIEAARITQAIRMIASGKMPKNRQLTPMEKNQLLADLLSLEHQETE